MWLTLTIGPARRWQLHGEDMSDCLRLAQVPSAYGGDTRGRQKHVAVCWEMLWLWDVFIPPSPVPPESVWSPAPALVNPSASPPDPGAEEQSCVSSACSPGNGTETEKEALAAKGGLGTA